MNRFEDELKLALHREEPSPDFTDRVMARINELPAPQKQQKPRENYDWRQKLAEFFRPPTMKWAMAAGLAIVLIVATFGANRYREHQQAMAEVAAQAEGQRAKEQVMLAMRIASAKLNVAQKKVNEAARRDDEPLAEHQAN